MQTQSGCGGGANEAETGREIAFGDDAFGRVLGSFGGIVKGVETMLEVGTMGRFQTNARRMNYCAIFEIPEIIDKLLQ